MPASIGNKILNQRKAVSSRASPLLGQGGVAAPVIKLREASSAGADGVVGSGNRSFGGWNEPPRPLQQRRLRGIFIDVASTPPWPRRGLCLLQRAAVFQTVALTIFLLFSAAFAIAQTSPLADAVMKKDSAQARALLQKNSDANFPQSDGTTALHWAARWDDTGIARELIRAGANARATNRTGATPLFLATMNGSAAMIDLLISAGADPNQPVLTHGETPRETPIANKCST